MSQVSPLPGSAAGGPAGGSALPDWASDVEALPLGPLGPQLKPRAADQPSPSRVPTLGMRLANVFNVASGGGAAPAMSPGAGEAGGPTLTRQLSLGSMGLLVRRITQWTPASAKMVGNKLISSLQQLDMFGYEPNPTPSFRTEIGAVVSVFGMLFYLMLSISLLFAFGDAKADLAYATVMHDPALVIGPTSTPARPELGVVVYAAGHRAIDLSGGDAASPLRAAFSWMSTSASGMDTSAILPTEKCTIGDSSQSSTGAFCVSNSSLWELQGSPAYDTASQVVRLKLFPTEAAMENRSLLEGLTAVVLIRAQCANPDSLTVFRKLPVEPAIAARRFMLRPYSYIRTDANIRVRTIERESLWMAAEGFSTEIQDLPMREATFTSDIYNRAADSEEPLLMAEFSLAANFGNLRITPDLTLVDVLGLLGSFLSLVILGLGIPTKAYNALHFHSMMRKAVHEGIVASSHLEGSDGDDDPSPAPVDLPAEFLSGVASATQGFVSAITGVAGSSKKRVQTREHSFASDNEGKAPSSAVSPSAVSTASSVSAARLKTPNRRRRFTVKPQHVNEVVSRLMKFEQQQHNRNSNYKLRQAYIEAMNASAVMSNDGSPPSLSNTSALLRATFKGAGLEQTAQARQEYSAEELHALRRVARSSWFGLVSRRTLARAVEEMEEGVELTPIDDSGVADDAPRTNGGSTSCPRIMS